MQKSGKRVDWCLWLLVCSSGAAPTVESCPYPYPYLLFVLRIVLLSRPPSTAPILIQYKCYLDPKLTTDLDRLYTIQNTEAWHGTPFQYLSLLLHGTLLLAFEHTLLRCLTLRSILTPYDYECRMPCPARLTR